MSIENPSAFILFPLVLALIIVYAFLYRTGIRDVKAMTHGLSMSKMSEIYFKKFFLSALFFTLTVSFLILTLADFKWKKEYVTENPGGVDVVFAVDVSNSMLADDLLPNRLEHVKRVMASLVETRPNFRYSLVAFKGSAVLQIPMTEDASGFYSGIPALSPALITTAGTDISEGLFTAIKSFPSGKESRKMIILFSDGAEGELKREQPLQTLLSDKKIKVLSVGCGTEAGGIIRLDSSRLFIDHNSQPKRVGMNDQILQNIADWTGGEYFSLEHPGISADISQMMESEARWIGVIDYSVTQPSQYHLFLILALISMGCYLFVRAKKMNGVF